MSKQEGLQHILTDNKELNNIIGFMLAMGMGRCSKVEILDKKQAVEEKIAALDKSIADLEDKLRRCEHLEEDESSKASSGFSEDCGTEENIYNLLDRLKKER